jgi:hypothetical protein
LSLGVHIRLTLLGLGILGYHALSLPCCCNGAGVLFFDLGIAATLSCCYNGDGVIFFGLRFVGSLGCAPSLPPCCAGSGNYSCCNLVTLPVMADALFLLCRGFGPSGSSSSDGGDSVCRCCDLVTLPDAFLLLC